MAQTKKQQITTSTRSGPMRMALGCVLIAIGFGWGLGLLVNTASVFSVLQFLRDTAHGLGGTLCTLLPVFALWGGVMLCVSARRKVSVRAYLIALVMYVILLSILTLWSSVSGQNLMTFVANCNKSWLGMQEHTSYGAYLVGAYNLRAFNGGMLAGGGLLGMLLAYPLYCTYFGTAGSAFILCAVELLLLLWLLRLNPFEMWKNVNVRRDARMQGQEEVDEEEYAPQPQPQRVQMHVEQLIPQQQVTYSRGTSVQSDVQESFLVPEQQRYEEYREPTPQDRGFVPVEMIISPQKRLRSAPRADLRVTRKCLCSRRRKSLRCRKKPCRGTATKKCRRSLRRKKPTKRPRRSSSPLRRRASRRRLCRRRSPRESLLCVPAVMRRAKSSRYIPILLWIWAASALPSIPAMKKRRAWIPLPKSIRAKPCAL